MVRAICFQKSNQPCIPYSQDGLQEYPEYQECVPPGGGDAKKHVTLPTPQPTELINIHEGRVGVLYIFRHLCWKEHADSHGPKDREGLLPLRQSSTELFKHQDLEKWHQGFKFACWRGFLSSRGPGHVPDTGIRISAGGSQAPELFKPLRWFHSAGELGIYTPGAVESAWKGRREVWGEAGCALTGSGGRRGFRYASLEINQCGTSTGSAGEWASVLTELRQGHSDPTTSGKSLRQQSCKDNTESFLNAPHPVFPKVNVMSKLKNQHWYIVIRWTPDFIWNSPNFPLTSFFFFFSCPRTNLNSI